MVRGAVQLSSPSGPFLELTSTRDTRLHGHVASFRRTNNNVATARCFYTWRARGAAVMREMNVFFFACDIVNDCIPLCQANMLEWPDPPFPPGDAIHLVLGKGASGPRD